MQSIQKWTLKSGPIKARTQDEEQETLLRMAACVLAFVQMLRTHGAGPPFIPWFYYIEGVKRFCSCGEAVGQARHGAC